jgi:phosphatidylinositol alpha 1,6-mannosyltransferase
MRVAYFTESLYPLVDGVSRTLARLFLTLERRGVDFLVFSPFVPGPDVSWSARVRPVRFVHFPPYPDYRVSLPIVRGIREDLAAFRPDLVHVVSPTPLAYRAQGLARALGIPVVASFHTHFVSYFRYYGIGPAEGLGWRVLRRFYRGCSRVYAPSPSIVSELRDHGVQGVELWSRGIDLGRFSPERRDPTLIPGTEESDGPVLLLVSRLVKEKDLGDLVGVDRALRQRSIPFRLVLVGDGPMRRELERALPEARFAGHRSGAELARWYASGDVFIFPSTTETLGNVVLEAQASGLPTVVVDRGGPQDLVQHGVNGFVARANDVQDIADRVAPLLLDAALRNRMGEAARRSAAPRDWEEINGTLLSSYQALVARGAR